MKIINEKQTEILKETQEYYKTVIKEVFSVIGKLL